MHRVHVDLLLLRLEEPRRFLQVLPGPRQVGKTTIVQEVLLRPSAPRHNATADGPAPPDAAWIDHHCC